MRHDHLGIRQFEISNRQFLHGRAINSFHQIAGASRAVAGKRGHTCSRFHRDLRVD